MMEPAFALEAAIYLFEFPYQVKLFRARPLPKGTVVLLRIASGDMVSLRQAADQLRRDDETIQRAVNFFLEQVLLDPDADSYRVLGATPNVESDELRRNMALLLRWLHPDLAQNRGRSIFARRVTGAWNDLKTAERRAAYDRCRPSRVLERSPKPKMAIGATKMRSRHRRGGSRGKLTSIYGMHQASTFHPSLVQRVFFYLLHRLTH
jgi:hypothetical protein